MCVGLSSHSTVSWIDSESESDMLRHFVWCLPFSYPTVFFRNIEISIFVLCDDVGSVPTHPVRHSST